MPRSDTTSLYEFPSRVHLALHGVPRTSLERYDMLEVLRRIAIAELAAFTEARNALRSIESAEELLEETRQLRRMTTELLTAAGDEQRAQTIAANDARNLSLIEDVKHRLGIRTAKGSNLAGIAAGNAEGQVRPISDQIRLRVLWREGRKYAALVEMDPGARWPTIDYHVPGPEEIWVVSGEFSDGANVYREGTFVHHPAGSSHIPTTETGCVLFAFYPEG